MGRKSSVISLTAEERDYLEIQTRARTIQAQTVNRARILLLKAYGCSIDDIADKVGINCKSVMLCLRLSVHLQQFIVKFLTQTTVHSRRNSDMRAYFTVIILLQGFHRKNAGQIDLAIADRCSRYRQYIYR